MAVYLLYGEETYLLEMRLKKIKKEFEELIQGINYISIDESNVEHLISDIETPAFGYAQKLIVARDTGLFKKEKKTTSKAKATTKKGKTEDSLSLPEKIANYLQENEKELENEITLVFVEEAVEKNILYQTIEKIGKVKEFALLKLNDLVTNLRKVAAAYEVAIDDGTAKYLVECCGTNMQDLINEIRKLIEYAGKGGTIQKQDVDLLCIKQIQAIIFDLTDNLGKRDIPKALEILNGLVENKEPMQKILVTLYNHFKKLYIVKIAEKHQKDLATAMDLKPNQLFLTVKYKNQAKYFEEVELRKILEEFINLDANYKVGLIDLSVGLEAILCRYCSK